jgi:hypothetical protein
MSEQERMLVKLGEVLAPIARPHRFDEVIAVEVQSNLWQIGDALGCTNPRGHLQATMARRQGANRTLRADELAVAALLERKARSKAANVSPRSHRDVSSQVPHAA